MIAFVDFTRDNGAASSRAVIAGLIVGCRRWNRCSSPSHPNSWPTPSRPVPQLCTSEGPCTGGAITDVPRRGAHLSYRLGWLRTEENNYLSIPPSYVKTLPRTAQAARLLRARQHRSRRRVPRDWSACRIPSNCSCAASSPDRTIEVVKLHSPVRIGGATIRNRLLPPVLEVRRRRCARYATHFVENAARRRAHHPGLVVHPPRRPRRPA